MKKLFLILALSITVLCGQVYAANNTFLQDYLTRGKNTKVQEVVNDTQIAADYGSNTDGSPVYLGYAVIGKNTSEDAWIIFKFTYDTNIQMLTKKTAYGAWDNRASLTYL